MPSSFSSAIAHAAAAAAAAASPADSPRGLRFDSPPPFLLGGVAVEGVGRFMFGVVEGVGPREPFLCSFRAVSATSAVRCTAADVAAVAGAPAVPPHVKATLAAPDFGFIVGVLL